MRKIFLVTCLWFIGSLLISPLSFATITVDGIMGDWGVSPGPYGNSAQWQPNTGVQFVQEDQTGPLEGIIGPGRGGQLFDVEALYFTQENSTAYFALVTGFPLSGTTARGVFYLPGDLAFDFGSNGSYEFGVDTTDNCGAGCTGGTSGKIELYKNATWDNPTTFPQSTPYALKTGVSLGEIQFAYDNTTYIANGHHVLEFGIPTSHFGSSWGDPFNVHWTMQCGNDLLDLHAVPPEIPQQNHEPVIPEPTTSLLMLLGLAGLGIRKYGQTS